MEEIINPSQPTPPAPTMPDPVPVLVTEPIVPVPTPSGPPKSIIIILIIVLLSSFAIVGSYLLRRKPVTTTSTSTSTQPLTSSRATSTTETTSSSECRSPLAPANAPSYVHCNYRQEKLAISEIPALETRLNSKSGVVEIPSTLTFAGQETYRGISIKWTAGQPLSPKTLTWLKVGIDLLPPYFYQDHPARAIISATDKELGSQFLFPPGVGTPAYANGPYIFINSVFAKGESSLYKVDQATLIEGLFHEWTHVVQYYETVMAYTEEYLGRYRYSLAMYTSPFNKSFATSAGWVIRSDQNGEGGLFADLGTDSESQKTTDYGHTKFIEDMAESGSGFMLCKTAPFSEARIAWWENATGTSRASYCPSKI